MYVNYYKGNNLFLYLLCELVFSSTYLLSDSMHSKNMLFVVDEHGSNYVNYVIWTGCILFIILIVVSSSICYVLNNNLLLKHSANVNSKLQERITKRAVLSSSEIVPGPCDTINEQTLCLDHEMEIQVVTTEAFSKNSN